MTTLAIIYIMLIILDTVSVPFLFGEERKPYSPLGWLLNIIFSAPLVFILLEYINY